MSPEERVARKEANRERYRRRFARHAPPPPSHRYPAELRLSPRHYGLIVTQGVPAYLQVVRMRYGAPGTWGHGRYASATKKGPGRRRIPPEQQNHPASTKLVRRFIRSSGKESTHWRRRYAVLTGQQYGVGQE